MDSAENLDETVRPTPRPRRTLQQVSKAKEHEMRGTEPLKLTSVRPTPSPRKKVSNPSLLQSVPEVESKSGTINIFERAASIADPFVGQDFELKSEKEESQLEGKAPEADLCPSPIERVELVTKPLSETSSKSPSSELSLDYEERLDGDTYPDSGHQRPTSANSIEVALDEYPFSKDSLSNYSKIDCEWLDPKEETDSAEKSGHTNGSLRMKDIIPDVENQPDPKLRLNDEENCNSKSHPHPYKSSCPSSLQIEERLKDPLTDEVSPQLPEFQSTSKNFPDLKSHSYVESLESSQLDNTSRKKLVEEFDPLMWAERNYNKIRSPQSLELDDEKSVFGQQPTPISIAKNLVLPDFGADDETKPVIVNGNQTSKSQAQIERLQPATSKKSSPTAELFRRFSNRWPKLQNSKNAVEPEEPLAEEAVQEPPKSRLKFAGSLLKPLGLGKKEFEVKRAILDNQKLQFCNSKAKISSEVPLDSLLLIHHEDDVLQTAQYPDACGLRLVLYSEGKLRNVSLVCVNSAERKQWLIRILESVTSCVIPAISLMDDCYMAGWCWLEECSSAKTSWKKCWLLIGKERSLVNCFSLINEYDEFDLRKARKVELCKIDEESGKCSFVSNTELITIDMISTCLRIQTVEKTITKELHRRIRDCAYSNGKTLLDLQLTLDNIPVVVNECLNFVFREGMHIEGIYRQSGSNSRISQLLTEFQKNAWAVKLSAEDYSCHDVAGALKRFFRNLPEPLVTSNLYTQWLDSLKVGNLRDILPVMMNILAETPSLNYNTMKALIGHLYLIHKTSHANSMPVLNLAPIWGPTLMNVEVAGKSQSYETACEEGEVVKILIENYHQLFKVTDEDIAKEGKFLDILEKVNIGFGSKKPSGDIKIWMYVWEVEESSSVNITLTPATTAHSIVSKICKDCQIRDVSSVAIYELICKKSLERPIHPAEKIMETVLRWSDWDEEERKHNILLMKKNAMYTRLLPYTLETCPLAIDVRFAEGKSKFKKAVLEITENEIKITKDSKFSKQQASWDIKSLVCYNGAEEMRNIPTKWAITFVPKEYHYNRTKDGPFGNVVCTSSEEDLHKCLGRMVIKEHPEGLFPVVIL